MSPRSIQEYAARLRPHYLLASPREKRRILSDVCRVTGYHRKSAIRLLRRTSVPRGHQRGRSPQYGPPVTQALRRLWEISDYLCSKRLAPFLPELLRVLERQGELRLAPAVRLALRTISPATIDRLLQPSRRTPPRSPYGRPPSVSLFRRQVPIRTFGEWRDVRPGALQADLVLHCGESLAGFHLASLLTIDVATGWTVCCAVWGRRPRARRRGDPSRPHLPVLPPGGTPHGQWQRVYQQPPAPVVPPPWYLPHPRPPLAQE